MVSITKAHAITVRREGGSELDGTGFSRIGIPLPCNDMIMVEE